MSALTVRREFGRLALKPSLQQCVLSSSLLDASTMYIASDQEGTLCLAQATRLWLAMFIYVDEIQELGQTPCVRERAYEGAERLHM